MARIDFRAYIKLEKALTSKLRGKWTPIALGFYNRIEEAVNAGDFAKAYAIAHTIDCTDLGVRNREYIKYVLLACANYGAAMAAGRSDTFVSAGTHEKFLKGVVDGFIHSIEYNMTIQAVKGAVQSIAKSEAVYNQETVAKAEVTRFLRPFVEFAEPTDSMLQLISSLHSSRVSTWGFTAEADVLGFTEYRLSAVLDGRTSAFCRAINGKVFKVADARKSIVDILSLPNPEDAKNMQPWPSQTKDAIAGYHAMSAEELTDANLHIPPYHPRCRTLLVRSTTPPRMEKPAIPSGNQILPSEKVTQDTFKELGLNPSEKEVDHWNAYMGINPIATLSKLSGLNPMDLLANAALSKARSIVMSATGDINFTLKGGLGLSGKYEAGVIYDPFTGTFFQNKLAFMNADPARAANFFKSLNGGLVDVGLSAGASEIVTLASGELGAYTYTKAGYLPSAGAWSDLQETLVADVAEGGKFFTEFASLSEEEQSLVSKLLASPKTESLYVLANLPFEVGGKSIGQILLQDQSLELTLDLTDKVKVAQAGKVFK